MLKISHISKTFNPGTVNEKKAIEDLSIAGGVNIDNATEAMIMALRAFNQGIKPFKNPPEGKNNNWLKMHGFHMRRKAGKRRIKL